MEDRKESRERFLFNYKIQKLIKIQPEYFPNLDPFVSSTYRYISLEGRPVACLKISLQIIVTNDHLQFIFLKHIFSFDSKY